MVICRGAGVRRLLPFFFAASLLAGCAGERAGVVAYKQGDYATAINEFRSEGSPEGDFALGLMFYKGEGVKRDLKEAAALFRRAAEKGHAGARYNLGLMSVRGQGVARDYKEAAHWYRLAAEQGYAKAQYNLGLMYARGDGVEPDRRQAMRWFAKAARQGNVRALQHYLALREEKQGKQNNADNQE